MFRVSKLVKPSCLMQNVRTFLQPQTAHRSNISFIHTSHNMSSDFWEPDPKSGYGSKKQPSTKELIRTGLRELKSEIMLWKDEVVEKFKLDPYLEKPGHVDIVWQFGKPEVHEKFIVTSDSDHNEGHSSCQLTMSPTGKGLFTGTVNTHIPKDGKIKRAGYCNIKSINSQKSFKRNLPLDWTSFTHIVLRVRGDGRSYLLNLTTHNFFDIMWNDVYHYVLFTRGGPYWQVSKIPFSKFFLGSKGRVQDKQAPIALYNIASFGITASDGINGPFRLEIDYVGLEWDPTHEEQFAYEMYKVDRLID